MTAKELAASMNFDRVQKAAHGELQQWTKDGKGRSVLFASPTDGEVKLAQKAINDAEHAGISFVLSRVIDAIDAFDNSDRKVKAKHRACHRVLDDIYEACHARITELGTEG